MNKGSLLLVDDDRQVLHSMADWLREQGYQLDTAASRAEAIAAVARKSYDVVLTDIRLADGDGFDVLAHCRRHHPATAVIMITGYGSVDSAVEAIRSGAFDFLTKPLLDEELGMAIERAIHQRKVIEENKNLKAQLDMRFGLENIVGHDHRMLRIYDIIQSVADTKATVLITGESGTGKSLIAKAIHRASSRRNKPFVEVACGALPETLLESELFGHVAGAFTGATNEKMGKFMQANEGTIFLDEVGTASPGNTSQAAADPAGFRVRAGRRNEDLFHRYSRHPGHQRRRGPCGGGGPFPPGPLLPHQRDQYRIAGAP